MQTVHYTNTILLLGKLEASVSVELAIVLSHLYQQALWISPIKIQKTAS